ncbi:MAG: aminoglycoside phosphotransferase family protein [Rhizobiaceae bacterium]
MNQFDPRAHAPSREPEPETLSRAMDTGHMGAALARQTGAAITDLRIARTHFSASRPVTIHYQYRLRGQSAFSTLIGEVTGEHTRAHYETERRRLCDPRRAQLDPDDDMSLFPLEDPGLVLRKPGLDPKLAGLRLLHDEAFTTNFLACLFDKPVTGSLASIELKAHRFGKRAVLAAKFWNWRGWNRRVFIRLRPTSYEAGSLAYAMHQRLAARHAASQIIRLPEPLAFDADLGAAVFSALSGRPPELTGIKSADDAGLCGNALRELREHGLPGGQLWTAHDEIAALEQWQTRIGRYRADLEKPFQAALDSVSRSLLALCPIEPAACHRDFHEGQLLIWAGECGLLDFDTLCLADPGLDIGNFCAHVRLSEIRGNGTAQDFETGFQTCASAGLDIGATRIGAWKRASLLRLAAIYAFSSEPGNVVVQLIAEARR